MKQLITAVILIFSAFTSSYAQHTCTKEIVSPNGKIKVVDESTGIQIQYKDANGWQCIMKMHADLTSEKEVTSSNKVSKVDYDMLLGKRKHCSNAFRSYSYQLSDHHSLRVKVYNDGVTWSGSCTLDAPNDTFDGHHVDFSSAKNNWLMQWTEPYEEFFPKNREQKKGARYGYPALFEYDNDVFALLSESNINKDCAASSLYADSVAGHFITRCDGKEMEAEQTLIIGSLSDIVESTLITDNSEPCKLSTNNWIQPGVAAWVYWAYNHGSNDFNIIKKYVDMAVELHLPYVLIDAEWDEMDKVASNNGKTIVDAVKYATDNGIKPIIWYNSSVGWVNGAPGPKYRLNKPDDREKEFAWCESIGVKGVKIDFFSGDNNLNIKYMTELLECAAKHHLLVNFHGATTMRGWQRTYPNLISTEGVYGEEWYNNVGTFTDKAACHNATLPFTRNVIGSMDYTPCAFTDSQHPHITTNAHELALTALYESGIQHLADRPESFLSQPQQIKDFLTNLPAAWDDTRLITGYPGEYAVMARQKGNTWYISGINGTDGNKTIALDYTRLKHLGKTITLFEDSGDASSPWKISSPATLPSEISLLPRGGFIIVINK